MAALFAKQKDFPTRDDEKIEEERRKRKLANAARQGRSSTIITGGGADLEALSTISSLALNTAQGG